MGSWYPWIKNFHMLYKLIYKATYKVPTSNWLVLASASGLRWDKNPGSWRVRVKQDPVSEGSPKAPPQQRGCRVGVGVWSHRAMLPATMKHCPLPWLVWWGGGSWYLLLGISPRVYFFGPTSPILCAQSMVLSVVEERAYIAPLQTSETGVSVERKSV